MNDLRAAAERILDPFAVRACSTSLGHDAIAVAEAWLAEHPADDDEPLTVEWVNATLQCIPGRGAVINHVLSLFSTRRGWIVSADKDGTDGDNSFCAVIVFTRGDVRRVCEAVGIELKEQGDGE